jgi:hypothetical protein
MHTVPGTIKTVCDAGSLVVQINWAAQQMRG